MFPGIRARSPQLTHQKNLSIIASTMQEIALPPLPPVRRTASEPALAYRVRPAADAAGETVVLLHGVGSSSATWAALAPLLDERYALVMPDYRGHGDSEAPEPPYDVADFVADLERLLTELRLERVHLVGFSIGAIFAQAYAAAHPAQVGSLVLLNSIAGRTAEESARAAERAAHIRATDPALVAAGSVERWFTPEFSAARPDVVAHELQIVSATPHRPYAAAYDVLAGTDLLEEAAQIASPVLLVTGENDRGSTPRMSQALHERIPGSRLVIVDGRQHYLHLEVPERIASLVNGHLADHPIR